jgi:oxygen-independent coproporphyrinogen-3 oxidase
VQEDILLDTIMLRLRTADGLDLKELAEGYGEDVVGTLLPTLHRYQEKGLVQLTEDPMKQNIVRARLSDPDGYLLSSGVISDLFAAFG